MVTLPLRFSAGVPIFHDGGPLHLDNAWRAWNLDLPLWAGLLLMALLYARGVWRLWRRAGVGHGVTLRSALAFGGGWLALAAALLSPIDPLAEALFSFHMIQHLLLALVAAPLMAAGFSQAAFAWGLPARWLAQLARWRAPLARRPHRFSSIEQAWRFLLEPVPAWLIHAAALWLWHLPGPYQAALENEAIHALEHAAFFLTGLLYWWSLLRMAAHARSGLPLRAGEAILSVFTMALTGGLLGALITFSASLWYPAYAEPLPGWPFTPLEDQQLAGVIMWVPTGGIYLGAVLWIVARLLADGEERPQTRPGTGKLWLLWLLPALLLTASACGGGSMRQMGYQVPNGDPVRGARLIQEYGCHSCHTIPGIPGATSLVGPPLNGWANRQYIAGALTNNPENLVRWIVNPQEIEPGTVMPNTGASEEEARHIAAYLYTLERPPRTFNLNLFNR